VAWPSSSITFCGEKIKNRNCNEDSKDPDNVGGNIRIAFG